MIEEKNKIDNINTTDKVVVKEKVNIWMIVSIVLITAIIVGAAVYFYLMSTINKEVQKEIPSDSIPSQGGQVVDYGKVSPTFGVPTGEGKPQLIDLGENWRKYTNPTLGFSMKIPKQVISYYGLCQYSTKDGDHSYRLQQSLMPVVNFEGENKVYLVGEYYYKLTGEKDENSRLYFSGCEKITNSLALASDQNNMRTPYWMITIASAANDLELDKYIKQRYGEGCNLGEKKPSNQAGVFTVSIKGDGLDMEKTKCPINYMTEVLYYPKIGKIANWDLGQSCSFAYPAGQNCLDTEMRDSFLFDN